jgi:CheY-like chemotaxis protein
MSKRILVVEDQPDNRQIIRDMLAPTDYEITETENGEEALAAIAKQRPDLILMDIQLPIMDVIPQRAGLKPILHCARSRSSRSPPTRSVAKRRRRGRQAVMTTCRNLSVRANCWRKFGSTCPNRSRSIAAVHESGYGPSRTSSDVRVMSEMRGIADIELPSIIFHYRNQKRALAAFAFDVRFTPESGHSAALVRCPLCAISGHCALIRSPRPRRPVGFAAP